MTTEKGGAPAETGAIRAKSGDGHGSVEAPVSIDEQQYEIVEWRQSQLPEFFDVKQAAAAWAALEQIEQKSHWWKVEILKQVDKNRWMKEFLKELKETYNTEISKQYANELRRVGQTLEMADMSATFKEEVRQLPVGTAIKVLRAENKETALDIAKEGTRQDLEQYLTEEKIATRDPLTPLQLRLFNSWNFSEAIHGNPGYEWGYNSGHITENLLWYYTAPNDLVIDPMVGSGTTIDACRRMKRRCQSYDKEDNILTGIETDELAQFIFLDPPFYTLKDNDFTCYDDFLSFVDKAIEESIKVLRIGGYLALIMMNLCEAKERRAMIGDCYELLHKHSTLTFENMLLCPLPTQQPGADRAKTNRELLNIARVVWVFRRIA